MTAAGDVQSHYTRGGLLESVLQAIREAGHDPDALDPDALAPAEEFHTLGRAATVALAMAAGVGATDHVLDVGSGLGGPARLLARRYGCRVTGIDLTPELCEVAVDLTSRVGLAGQVEIRHGDALALPFDDASFDVVWTQHASMNIEDKRRLFAGLRRVVRPGGRLAFFDVLAGQVQPIHFPVPWADDASLSFLATVDETLAVLAEVGFSVRVWDDVTNAAQASFRRSVDAPSGPAPLGLHLLIANLPAKLGNLARNLDEGRVVVIRGVAEAV